MNQAVLFKFGRTKYQGVNEYSQNNSVSREINSGVIYNLEILPIWLLSYVLLRRSTQDCAVPHAAVRTYIYLTLSFISQSKGIQLKY